MTASSGAPAAPAAFSPHRCTPPGRAIRGAVYECWCGRDWVALASLTIRKDRIVSLRPDWRVEGMRPRRARSAIRPQRYRG
jgi:hypothetical protein